MPGATDPASAALPQQGIHRAVLQGAGRWSGSPDAHSKGKDEEEDGVKAAREVRGGIELYNNPSWVQFGTKKILATSGQNLDDIMKYVPVRARPEAAIDSASEDKMDVDSGEAAEAGEGGGSGSANGASGEAGAGESQQELQGEEEEEDERLTAAGRLLEFGHVAPTAPDTLCECKVSEDAWGLLWPFLRQKVANTLHFLPSLLLFPNPQGASPSPTAIPSSWIPLRTSSSSATSPTLPLKSCITLPLIREGKEERRRE